MKGHENNTVFQIVLPPALSGREKKESFRRPSFPTCGLALLPLRSSSTTQNSKPTTIIIMDYCKEQSIDGLFSLLLQGQILLIFKMEQIEIDMKKGRCYYYCSIVKVTFTLFEKDSKCLICILTFWHFLPIFVQLQLTCLVTLFDCKLQLFKNSPKLTLFGIFMELLSTHFTFNLE